MAILNPGECRVESQVGFYHNGHPRVRVERLLAAPVASTRTVSRKATAVPLTLWHYPGPDRDLRIAHTDGGHLVALELGGPNDGRNVVPMYSGFNRWGPWKEVERQMRRLLEGGRHPGLLMRVEVAYDNADKRLPSAFRARGLAADGVTEVYDSKVLPHPAPVPDQFVNTDEDVRLVTDAAGKVKGWTIEGHLSTLKDEAPVSLNLPPVADRPYALLDRMMFEGKIDQATIGNGFGFSAGQRNNILTVNRIRNGGWVKSDDPKDPHQVLSIDGGDFGAEIDHIVPKKGRGGSNAYSNARVISSAWNKTKGMTAV